MWGRSDWLSGLSLYPILLQWEGASQGMNMNTPLAPTFDPAHDVLHYERQALDAIFAPKNIAVIGATENQGTVGRTVLWNLISNPFGGAVFPVNPKRASILGVKAYANIASVPEPVDL